MDTRIPLKPDTVLEFRNSGEGKVTFVIGKEYARGGSSIVYEGYYVNNQKEKHPVRIKECYPFKLKLLRDERQGLSASGTEAGIFEDCKNRMRNAFKMNNVFFHKESLGNRVVNTVDIYEAHNTVYIVTTLLHGKVLSQCIGQLSLRERIAVVKSCSYAIQSLHEQGYLYLDLKPDNIFLMDGTFELVQLFDFDSLYEIGEDKEQRITDRISYTKGFAPLELQAGNLTRLGTHTDIYEIGALLFYLLFGHTPTASECETDHEYPYDSGLFINNVYQDKLYFLLTEIFHHTLSSYYPDRYSNAGILLKHIECLYDLADPKVPFLKSSFLPKSGCVFGRENEILKLDEWLKDDLSRCLFVTGMGGIGKSTLVSYFVSLRRENFDSVNIIYSGKDLMRSVADDSIIPLNTTLRQKEETEKDYFARKTRVLRRIVSTRHSILIIENFDGTPDEIFWEIVHIGWKVLILTRKEFPEDKYDTLKLDAIRDCDAKYRLFETNLGRKLDDRELPVADRIIEQVCGHTLLLELIAKQIKASFITLEEAQMLAAKYGFSGMAAQKISYTKDHYYREATIREILNALYQATQITVKQKQLLRVLSVFKNPGIDILLFKAVMPDFLDDVNECKNTSWINVNEKMISLHPLIRETVSGWELKDYDILIISQVMNSFCEAEDSLGLNREERERYLRDLLFFTKEKDSFNTQKAFFKLICHGVKCVPRDREDFYLEYIPYCIGNASMNDPEDLMELFDQIIDILLRKELFKEASEYIEDARVFVSQHSTFYLRAAYYSLKADFYDARLNGAYFQGNRYGDERNLIKSLDLAMKYLEKSNHKKAAGQLVKHCLSKANILMRGKKNLKYRESIIDLMNRAGKLIRDEKFLDSELPELKEYYAMACGWYYTLIKRDEKLVTDHTDRARYYAKKRKLNTMDYISYILVPSANMFFEMEDYMKAICYLKEAVQLCEFNDDMPVYKEEKKNLLSYLCEVYDDAGMTDLYEQTMHQRDML